MDTIQKKNMMDKMVRELEDVLNSQTSLLKKITQLEADNINLGNSILDERLPSIHEKVDERIIEISSVMEEFITARNKFVEENPIEEGLSG